MHIDRIGRVTEAGNMQTEIELMPGRQAGRQQTKCRPVKHSDIHICHTHTHTRLYLYTHIYPHTVANWRSQNGYG